MGAVIHDGTVLDANCRILNDTCYLDIDTVQQYLHNRFYYTEVSREIRYTDANTVVVAPLDGVAWTSTASGATEQYEEDYVISLTIDDTCYIALDFVEKFVPVTHSIYRDPDRVVIESMELCKEMVTVKRDTAVRWRAGVKSDILAEVAKGEQVMVLEVQDAKNWTKVVTRDGLIGYIRNTRLGTKEMVTGASTLEYKEPEYESTQLDEKIRMGFHAVYNMTANGELEDMLTTAYNINVISPTWFSLNDNVGNFSSIASKEYVEKAHELGIQVWALIEDITNDVDMYQILADSNSRTHLITGIMNAVLEFDLDGINIDFEGIRKSEGAHFVQFLRELSILCRENDVILSVDNYPPNAENTYYAYEEQGIVVDYVVLMGYDEHWHNCGDPGSTASQPFVERSLDKLVSMVNTDKIIHALPFYTRMWKRTEEGVTDWTIFMKDIDENVSELGMVIDFDETTGQKYASIETDEALYEMWIEDYASIENKLIAVTERNLAGVAAWRLGYENPEIWDLIGSYIQ